VEPDDEDPIDWSTALPLVFSPGTEWSTMHARAVAAVAHLKVVSENLRDIKEKLRTQDSLL
jgi:hypothetical protein